MTIYFLVAIVATTIGSMTGLGGGVIIKPVLDNLGKNTLVEVTYLSTATIFSMALITTYKNSRAQKTPFSKENFNLLVGAFLGGILGSNIFNLATSQWDDSIIIKIQAIFLIGLIIATLLMEYFDRSLHIDPSKVKLLIAGLAMGTMSAFLGIGGGPVNMAILMTVFDYKVKDSAVKSTVIILVAQLTNLILLAYSRGVAPHDLSALKLMVPGAILGAYLGSKANLKISEKGIKILFNLVMVVIILLNLRIVIS